LVQLLNIYSGMDVILDNPVTFVNEVHPLKTLPPLIVVKLGRFIVPDKLEQF